MSARQHTHSGQPRVFHKGDKVVADFGGNYPIPGPFIAFVFSGPHDNAAGETKYEVQAPDGSKHPLGYREPQDREGHGSGGTFWTL